jgi:hypothetical protein
MVYEFRDPVLAAWVEVDKNSSRGSGQDMAQIFKPELIGHGQIKVYDWAWILETGCSHNPDVLYYS